VGELWMLALTVLTALNTFNGGFLVASRFIYAAARENNLPRQFAWLNLQAVPWVAVTSLAVVSAVVAAVVFATGQWLLLVAVGAAIEALDQLREMLGLIGKVCLQNHDCVATRIARAPRGLAAQGVDRGGVARSLAAENGERHDLVIRLERLGGRVGASVVIHEHFVLARLLLEHLAKAPEQQPDGRSFVVCGNAEVEHVILNTRDIGAEGR